MAAYRIVTEGQRRPLPGCLFRTRRSPTGLQAQRAAKMCLWTRPPRSRCSTADHVGIAAANLDALAELPGGVPLAEQVSAS